LSDDENPKPEVDSEEEAEAEPEPNARNVISISVKFGGVDKALKPQKFKYDQSPRMQECADCAYAFYHDARFY
jgi:hypothetical protein